MLKEIFRRRQVKKDLEAVQKATDKLLGADLITMDDAVDIRAAARLRAKSNIEHDNGLVLNKAEAQALVRLSDSGRLSREISQKVQKLVPKRQPGSFRTNRAGIAPLYTRRSFLESAGIALGGEAVIAFGVKDMIDQNDHVHKEVNQILETAKLNSMESAAKDTGKQTIEGLEESYADKTRMAALRQRLVSERWNELRVVAETFGIIIGTAVFIFGGTWTVCEIEDWKYDYKWSMRRKLS